MCWHRRLAVRANSNALRQAHHARHLCLLPAPQCLVTFCWLHAVPPHALQRLITFCQLHDVVLPPTALQGLVTFCRTVLAQLQLLATSLGISQPSFRAVIDVVRSTGEAGEGRGGG